MTMPLESKDATVGSKCELVVFGHCLSPDRVTHNSRESCLEMDDGRATHARKQSPSESSSDDKSNTNIAMPTSFKQITRLKLEDKHIDEIDRNVPLPSFEIAFPHLNDPL